MQQCFVDKLDVIKNQVKKSKNKEVLLFADASHMNGIIYPDTIWQQIGNMYNKKFYNQKHQNKISILGAVDAFGSHELTSITTENSVNKAFFISFLELLSEKYGNKKINLVLDNARYQKNDDVMKKAEMLGISLIFLPPYCPNLNLIERLWKFFKKKIAQANLLEKNLHLNLLLSNLIRKFAKKKFKTELNSLLSFKFQII